MKPILFESTLRLAKAGKLFLRTLNDQPKEISQKHFASDTLQGLQDESNEKFNLFIKELQNNLENVPPINLKAYLMKAESHFLEHKKHFQAIKAIEMRLEENEILPATEIAWRKMSEIINNDSPSFTSQEKSVIFCYYLIASRIIDFCNLGLYTLQQQSLNIVANNVSMSYTDDWDDVLINGFNISKLKLILSILPSPILDEEGILTIYSKPGNWAAVIAALRQEGKISLHDNATLHRLLVKEFGPVASENHLREGYQNSKSKTVEKIFNSTLALAGT